MAGAICKYITTVKKVVAIYVQNVGFMCNSVAWGGRGGTK